jgi:hypothetical protein
MVPFDDYPGVPVWILRDDHELELLATVSARDEIERAFSDKRWIRSFAKFHRIDYDQIGHVRVSTVFLGSGHFPFETSVDALSPDGEGGSQLAQLEEHRWKTWLEAIDGHEAHLVKWRRLLQPPGQRLAVASE